MIYSNSYGQVRSFAQVESFGAGLPPKGGSKNRNLPTNNDNSDSRSGLCRLLTWYSPAVTNDRLAMRVCVAWIIAFAGLNTEALFLYS